MIRSAASAGAEVSACRNSNASPRATRAPACICCPRPRSLVITCVPYVRAISVVPSVLPPSTKITSTRPRTRANAASVAPMVCASLSVGMMMDSARGSGASTSWFIMRLASSQQAIRRNQQRRARGLSVSGHKPRRALRDERQLERFDQFNLCRRAKGRHADCDLVLRHVQTERAVQPVPDGQPARPVRVRLILNDGMMYAVHARRDDKAIQLALKLNRQTHVRVMKQDREQHECLPDGERERPDAEQ